MANFIQEINNILWGIPMISLLLGIHLFFTFKLSFIQKNIFKSIKMSFKNNNSNSKTSAFSTLSTTLAATLGTGNIVGVSTAIALGGPGAVFWCWITGVLGMATSYAECYLGIKYRIQKNNTYYGGPMYVLEYGVHNKFLAIIFAFCTILASFGVGCTTQSSSISSSMSNLFHLSPHITGFIFAILCGFIIIGGFNSISNICTKLVPSMALFYITGCFTILFINRHFLIDSISLIIYSAFKPTALAGGLIASSVTKAIRYGVSRGLFTNEAGLGSTPITASIADSHPIKEQSLISMSATFWDTVVMCAITGIAIVSTFLSSNYNLDNINNTDLVTISFQSIPIIGDTLLSIALIAFAFATLIGWFAFGEKCFEYLFGTKHLDLYKIIYIVMIYVGAVISLDIVWEMCDLFNALMAIPNIISLIILRNQIQKY